LNTALVADRSGDPRFCTAVLARVRPRPAQARVRMAMAGHPPVLILRNDGRVDQVGPTGPLLGVFPDVRIRTVDVALGPGDVCVLYTDGATDVRHDGRTFGEAGLLEVVAGCRGLPAAAIATSIVDAVLGFQRGDVRDDLALVVLHVPPFAPEDDEPPPPPTP
jgi:serine phosphatase RsbU (regulator of sigma subunit)